MSNDIATPATRPKRTLLLGDLHGAYRALIQVLRRASYSPEDDTIIFIGDVCDGWPETRECVELLYEMPYFVGLLGNHDAWWLSWLNGDAPDDMWVSQGGIATLDSYAKDAENPSQWRREHVPWHHYDFVSGFSTYHIDDQGRLYVHGGFETPRFSHPSQCSTEHLLWDRSLWQRAVAEGATLPQPRLTEFTEVFIGHTSTTRDGWDTPAHRCEVWNVDQGAGWEGKLSLLDVDSKQFWQSDPVADLYPNDANERNTKRPGRPLSLWWKFL